jgi:septal ring factor EnvC (AmiA/AmiB activator)
VAPRLKGTQPRIAVAVTAAVALLCGVMVMVSLAGAAPSETEQRLDSARSEAQLITQRINAKSDQIAELEQRAAVAAAREQELGAQLRESTARSTALNDDLLAAEKQLELVRARYKRSVGVLADRLVEIYKGSDVDYLTVVLESEGFDDLQTRSEYLEALTEADGRIADRVSALHDEVAAGYQEIADLKASIDEEARKLEAARAEIESVHAAARARAAEVADAKAEEEAALGQLQQRISGWELEVRREAAEQLDEGAYLGGPYSIPTYIVMCESGGNYRALNPSSGAGGAYQIIPSTWRSYGGSGLPHQASKAEQDRIAAKIWADVGASAWSCA